MGVLGRVAPTHPLGWVLHSPAGEIFEYFRVLKNFCKFRNESKGGISGANSTPFSFFSWLAVSFCSFLTLFVVFFPLASRLLPEFGL